MKKILAISSVLLGVVFLAGCGQQQVNNTRPVNPVANQQVVTKADNEINNWRVYSDEKSGYEIKIPQDFTVNNDGSFDTDNTNSTSFFRKADSFMFIVSVSKFKNDNEVKRAIDLTKKLGEYNEVDLFGKTALKADGNATKSTRIYYLIQSDNNMYELSYDKKDEVMGEKILSTFKFIPMQADTPESLKADIKAHVKTRISSAVLVGIVCRDNGGEVLSGNGESPACSKNSDTWLKIEECGPEKTDTQWTVFNGKNDNWDATLLCKNFTDCNGPQNAICNSDGCKFSGSCQ
jgi:hypothetical protein